MRRLALLLLALGSVWIIGFAAFWGYSLASGQDTARAQAETVEWLFLATWLLQLALLVLYATLVMLNPRLHGRRVLWLLLLLFLGPIAELVYWVKYLWARPPVERSS